MRRLIAYIMMAVSMLIAIGVAATPVLTKLNGGREYNTGREIVFNVDSRDGSNVTKDNVDKVADEMRSRLNKWHIEDYSVKIQSSEENENKSYSVAVSINVEKDVFNYVAKYLCFDGGNISISGTDPESLKENVFKLNEARIVYESDLVPVVVIPVTDSGKADIENLVKQLNPEENTEGGATKSFIRRADDHDHDHETVPTEGEGTGEEQKQPDIFMWANHDDGDLVEKASVNPLVKDKILMSFYSTSIWYEKAKEEHSEVQFICGSANEANEYDLTKLKDANVMANYYLNMLQASKYDLEVTCPTRNVTQTEIDYYTNSLEVAPSMESLLTLSNNVNVRMSSTLIATLIAIVIISLLLIVYFRINSIAIIVTTLGSLFITLFSFSSMNVIFNLPAVIGLIALAGCSLFGEILYCHRFKEEVYKGRSFKKANQEASRKSNLLTLDVAVITAFTGLMMYALGGTALKPMGVILFFGAVFSLLMNLIIFKILMYLVTNSTNLQSKYSVFNINPNKVPSLTGGEEKEEYTATYENVNFTKNKKISGIILGVLAVAAVTVITVFGVKDGSPLNVKNATKDTTVVYTTMTVDNGFVNDVETFKQYALKDVKSDDNTQIPVANIETEMKKVQTYTYDETSPETTETLFFTSKISNQYNQTQLTNIGNSIKNSLEDNLHTATYDVVVQTSKELNYTPDQSLVILATAIAIIGSSFYIALRFRPSRGIAALVVTTGSTAIAYGLFVGVRVGTTAATALGMPLVALSTLLLSIFYFATEKTMVKERRNEQLSYDDRKAIMVKALARSASPMLILMLIVIYLSINFFGFGLSQTALLFGSALIGQIAAVVAILTILGPLSCLLGKWLSKITMPKLKIFEHKEKANVPHKRNSSEPEETIFIGIND